MGRILYDVYWIGNMYTVCGTDGMDGIDGIDEAIELIKYPLGWCF